MACPIACGGVDFGRMALSFEIVYGHALKPKPRAKVAAETEIGLAQMRQMLKR